jgi:hypothetical protein
MQDDHDIARAEPVLEQGSNSHPAQGSRYVRRVSERHAQLVDALIQEPRLSLIELGKRFGYHPDSLSRILASPCVRAFHAHRREELIDPLVREAYARNRSSLGRRPQGGPSGPVSKLHKSE